MRQVRGSVPAGLLDIAAPRCGPFDSVEVPPHRRDQIIDAFAQAVVRCRLEAAAILFLEMHRPLTTVAATCVTFSQPTLGLFFGFGRLAEWASLLNDRRNIDRLVRRIEEFADGTPSQAPEPAAHTPLSETPGPTPSLTGKS